MIIIWGTKHVRSVLGRVADYCPVCQERRSFTLREVRRVSHIYYIPLGHGTVVGHEMICDTCRVLAGAALARYRTVVRDPQVDVDELTDLTNPGLFEQMSARLDLQARALEGRITAEERRALLLEPFLAINPALEVRAASMHLDRYSSLGLLAMLVLPWFLLVPGIGLISGPGSSSTGGLLIGLGIALAATGLVVTIVAATTEVSRFARREYGRRLVEALVLLDPTLEELQEICGFLQKHGRVAGWKIKARWLHQQITLFKQNAGAVTVGR